MYQVKRSALIPFTAQQMYDLVNDVAAYPQFLPWCGGSEVFESSDSHMKAAITIAFKGINKTFSTHNELQPGEQIILQLTDGPFSELKGVWRFENLGDLGCKIELDLQFNFSNRIVGAVVGPVFRHIADSMVGSFSQRAEQLYNS